MKRIRPALTLTGPGVALIALLLISLGQPRRGFSQEAGAKVRSSAASMLGDSQEASEAERARSFLEAGNRARKTSDPRRAIENYEKALAAFRKLGNLRGEGTTLNHLGEADASLSQYAKAIGFYEQALAIEREVSDRKGEAATLTNFGDENFIEGKPARADDPHQQRPCCYSGGSYSRPINADRGRCCT